MFKKCTSCGVDGYKNNFNEDGICLRCEKTATGNTEPLEVFGIDTVLRVDGSSIVIRTLKNGSTLTIPIASIQEFILEAPGFFSLGGKIIIATAKTQSGIIGYAGDGVFMGSSFSSKRTFSPLCPLELEYAKEVQKYITEFQANGSVPTAQFSVADELIKLKALHDDGVLTQEEFDRKKSKLLGD